RGNQFVTGPCSVDSDCQQGCCGFSTGKCAGPAVAQTNGSGGCGHGTAAPNCNTAAAFVSQLDGLPFTPATASNTTSANTTSSNASTSSSSNATATAGVTAAPTADQSSKKTVFETCSADSDCQQGCCGFSTGKCAGPGIAQSNGSGGCGHGTAAPNCNVAAAL
ncbi:hypothetical protein PUNSTDRAFT_18794, partial [Punctularia strigosozonata HHB-11173 SS5]|uniref:uncharacterized protein n=1 Tax=Punctularia strigosozonata (strain HHB-11173) TaxID=741275 RepID=UPI0004418302